MNAESLYSLLESAVRRNGTAPAAEFSDSHLSYAELHSAALRLAEALRTRGAVPGQRVAFCFRKSIDALTSLFAIIRTGATYVPLDPTWPAERMNAILRDAGIHLWTGTSAPPPGVTGVTTALTVDGEGAASLQQAASATAMMDGPPMAPERGIANILYTSGSTGRPKGVEITTRSLLHFSQWGAEHFSLTPRDRIANHAPYNFDLSTFDIFAAVRAGAVMCPVPEAIKMFPYQTAKFIADRRISVWYSVPSALVMMQLRGKIDEHDFSHLRHVIFAGEVMPKPGLIALARAIPRATWTNLYGPTETNVCTFHTCTPEDFARDDAVPIGRAISDTRLWVVDDEGREVQKGESGELRVAGPTVTTGYFGDADLTARKCVASPDRKSRCYRTGDRVRQRADGVLLFEGRLDRMIKCRGHRIEPGEIEAALHRHPAVNQAAVIPLSDPVFGNRLRAFISAKEGMTLNESMMTSFCKPLIPSYMMPDDWRFLDCLPLTDRGKIDLQALMRAAST